MDVRAKFGDSTLNRCRDIRVTSRRRRTTADAGHDTRQKRSSAFSLKTNEQMMKLIVIIMIKPKQYLIVFTGYK